MADSTRAQYLNELLSQKRQNSQQGGNVVNQGGDLSSSSNDGDGSDENWWSWKKLAGAFDTIKYDGLWAGAAKFFEGWADLAATGIGALGDFTGWYDSTPFTDWAKHDLAGQFGKAMKSTSIDKWIGKALNGELNGEWLSEMGSAVANVFTGADDESFDETISDNYLYDESNFMTDNKYGQFAQGIIQSIGEMLPSIALGDFVGAAGAGEKAAKAVGTLAMSVAAAGGSASDALNDGATAGQALGYGAASGAVEFGTEYIPWEKIPGLGKLLGENTLPGVGLRSFSVKGLMKSMAQEGLEEVVSEMANPILQCIYKGTDALKQYDFANNPDEAGEFYKRVFTSFLSGAITGGIMEGANMGANSLKYSPEGVDYVNGLTEYAKEYSDVYNDATKLDADYAKGKVTSEERLDALDQMASKLKEIDSQGRSLNELWEKIPDSKKANVAKLVMDPSQWADFSGNGRTRIEQSRDASAFDVMDRSGQIKTVQVQEGDVASSPMAFDTDIERQQSNGEKAFEPYDGTTTVETDPNLSAEEKANYKKTKEKATSMLSELEKSPLPYEPDESKPKQYMFAAPLYKSNATSEADFTEIMTAYGKKCENIAKKSGCSFESAVNANRLYENGLKDFIDEPSLSICLGNVSEANADLAASLIADNGYQQQESSIVYNYVSNKEFSSLPESRKAILFQINFADGDDVASVRDYFKINKIPATITKDGLMFLKSFEFDFGSDVNAARDFYVEIKKYCDTLKAEGKLNENSEIKQYYVNERYHDSGSRQDVYENWDKTRDSSRIRDDDGQTVQKRQPESDQIIEKADSNAKSSKEGPLSISEEKTKATDLENKAKAYRKAQATYESNQQLLKDAAPNKAIDLKTATNYASAEADLVSSLINRDMGENATFYFETSKTGRKFSAAIDTSLSNEAALQTLDAQFADMLESGKVKVGNEKAVSLSEYASKEAIDEIKEIAHQLHESLLDEASESKLSKERKAFESKIASLKDRVASTVEMAKEVDRFNKNAEITKRQFKIDQSKYAEEFKADATLQSLAKTMPRYNVLQEDGRRSSDNSGLGLRKASYEKWANESFETVKGLYDSGQLLNFDKSKADELFDAYDTVINGGDSNSKTLTIDQVKAMTKITKLLRFQLSETAARQRVEVRNTATGINTEVSYRLEASPRSVNKVLQAFSRFSSEQVKMLDYGNMIMGYDGSSLQASIDSLREAKRHYYTDYYGIKEKYLATDAMDSLMKEIKGKTEFDGRKRKKAELLDAYLMLSDPETRALMDADGEGKTRRIRFSDGSYIEYSDATYESLEKAIGKETAERAKRLLITGFYNDHSDGSYLNKLRDYQLKKIGDTSISDNVIDHYPRSQSSDVTSRANSVDALKSNGGKSTASNGSVTKSRQSSQSIAVLEAMDPFTRADSYAKQVSNEMNLRYQSNEFLRALGMNVTGTDGKTTRLQMTLGTELTGYLRDFVTSINDIDLVSTDGLISKAQGGITAATLGMSPINPAKNFISLFKEGHEVGMSNVARAILSPSSWTNGELSKAIMETGTWKARYDGGVLSMEANTEIKGKWANAASKLTYLYTLADQATSLLMAQADYQYVKRAYPGLSKEELMAKAVELWETNVDKTQSTAERVGKSQSSSGRFMGRDSQIVKALWTFQSDVVTGASMLVNDMSMLYTSGRIIKWANGVMAQEGSVSAEKLAMAQSMLSKAKATRGAIIKRRLPAGAAAALLGALLKYMIESLNSRVKGKTGWDEALFNGDSIKEMAANAASSVIPFMDTVSSALEYNDGQPELFGLSGITDTLQALSELMNGKTRTGVIDLAKSIAAFGGIPLKNIYDYTIGFVSGFDPKVAIESKNLLYQAEKAQTAYSSNFNTALYERVGDVSEDCRTEIKTLYAAGYDSKPSSVYDTYKDAKGDEVTISWSDKQTMRRYYQRANSKLSKMISSDSYRQLDDSSRAKAIKRLYSAYRDASLAKVVTKEAPTSVATALAYANYSDLGTMLSAVSYISALEATKTATKKERAVAYVNSLKGLTKAQRMVILKMAGYTVDASYVKTVLKQAGLSNDAIKKIAS